MPDWPPTTRRWTMAQRYPDDYGQVFMRSPCRRRRRRPTHLCRQLKSVRRAGSFTTRAAASGCDASPSPTTLRRSRKGCHAARRPAGIAPAMPHTRHVPSRIYSMVGLCTGSIASILTIKNPRPTIITRRISRCYAHLRRAGCQGRAMIENPSPRRTAAIAPSASLFTAKVPAGVICARTR